MKSLPHASRGWWGASVGGAGEDRVLYLKEIDLLVEPPEIELELEDIEIILEVEVDEDE